MNRRIMLCCGAAMLASPLLAADKPPREVSKSNKPSADVVSCLSEQISRFDSPNVTPLPGGRTHIVTRVLHVTRIDLTVTSAPTTVEVRGKSGKKLRQIIGGCL
jgi:hypothetical protein